MRSAYESRVIIGPDNDFSPVRGPATPYGDVHLGQIRFR